MPKNKVIPDDIREQVGEKIKEFNKKMRRSYVSTFKGQYLYLGRIGSWGKVGPICRLRYTGDINNWDFTIYKYSDNRYDPNEFLFPGSSEIDGSIEGAMKAGLTAYPD